MKNLIASLTLEEKAAFLTGAASMETAEISRLCTVSTPTARIIPSAVLAWI